MTLERIIGVLLLVGFLLGGTAFAAQYFGARGRIAELEDQRGTLTTALQRVALQRDSIRAVGDTIGDEAVEENTADLEEFVELEEQAAEVRIVIVEREDTAALRLDSLRLEQIAAMQRVHVRDSLAIVTLRRQLFDERDLHDLVVANVQKQLDNVLRQRDLALAMAPGNFLQEILDDPVVLAVGTVIGAGACFAWCPR